VEVTELVRAFNHDRELLGRHVRDAIEIEASAGTVRLEVVEIDCRGRP
jgi:hypothetical protein